MSAAVDVTVVLQRAGMLEDLAAFVTGVTTHTIGSNGKGLCY